MNSKSLFQQFCIKHGSNMPLFLQYTWWNDVVQDSWEVAVLTKGNNTIAVWPYLIRKKGPWKILTNPHFTPYCGPFIHYPEDQKESSKISFENKVYQELLDLLPEFSEFSQHLNFFCKNTLAFLWKGFSDQKRYTYLLDLKQTEEELWSNLRENTRRQIRKAEKTIKNEVHHDAVLIENGLKGSYESQSISAPEIESNYYERISTYLQKENAGFSIKSIDEENNCHASLTLVWDEEMAYYLIGGALPEFKNSGALSLLLWHAIKESKKAGKTVFNFEGSVIPTIEKYLRGFGGKLTPYSKLFKDNSKSLKLAKRLKK